MHKQFKGYRPYPERRKKKMFRMILWGNRRMAGKLDKECSLLGWQIHLLLGISRSHTERVFQNWHWQIVLWRTAIDGQKDSDPSHLSILCTCCPFFFTSEKGPPSWQRSSKMPPQQNHTKSFEKQTSSDPSSIIMSTRAKNFTAIIIFYLTGIKMESCKALKWKHQAVVPGE